jgi:hypothetical protein
MSTIKRMPVPSAFRPTSELAFSYAIEMAVKYNSSIRLLYVADDASFAAGYPDGF